MAECDDAFHRLPEVSMPSTAQTMFAQSLHRRGPLRPGARDCAYDPAFGNGDHPHYGL